MSDAVQKVTVTKCFWALKHNEKPVIVLEGSSGSGKTYSIIQYLIDRCTQEKLRVFAGRYDGTTCDGSIIADFRDIMQDQFGIWERGRWNATRRIYTFRTGAELRFGELKNVEKLHGPRQDICWINEAMEVGYDSWTQLRMRTRQLAILDFNPSLTQHWVFDRVLSRDPSEYTYVHSTFRDNPYLSPAAVEEILGYEDTPANRERGTADPWRWQVYGLGKRGVRENVIFRLWDKVDEWPDRFLCPRWGFGLDFGFASDPSALVQCAIFQEDLFMRERLYEAGLVAGKSASVPSLPSIEGRLEELEIPQDVRIWADCARPDSIYELQQAGWNLVPCAKGPDSVLAGINLMRGRRIRVLRSSQNLQRELEMYVWKQKPDGTILEEPEDEYNHLLDGARYWAMGEIGPKKRSANKARPRQAKTVVGKRW